MSSRVAEYSDLVASLARRHCTGKRVEGQRTPTTDIGGEYDDLYQEGLIFVWQSLGRGVHPSKDLISARMSDWKKLLKYQQGRGGRKDASYATLLPLEDFHGASV